MDLVVAIATNVVLGGVLLALFLLGHGEDDVRLRDEDEALRVFRSQFPDAAGAVTLTVDRRAALLALDPGTTIGLLERRGRKWASRALSPHDLLAVELANDETLRVTLADFGWPRASFKIADADKRAAWRARLHEFMAIDARRSPAESAHA
jgi:hypothetical protein